MTRFFKTLLFSSLCAGISLTSVAQEPLRCGADPVMSKWLEQYFAGQIAVEKNDDFLYVPLTIHIFGDDNGEGHVAVNSVLNALCTLNEDYASANIQFYIQGDIRYVNRSRYYNHTQNSSGSSIHAEYNIPNTINCYIVNNAANALGYAPPGGNYVVLIKGEMRTGSHTWPHEMGHSLSLPHTFYGWENYDFNFENNAPDRVYGGLTPGGRLVERTDGTNCQGAGDGFCDTPPDYLSVRWDCDTEGKSNIVQKDPNGITFKSDGTNVMSYSYDECVTRFSEDQKQAMRTHLQTAKAYMLNRAEPVPNIDDLKTELISPSKNESVLFNNVYLEWLPVADATHYLVEVSRVSTFASQLTNRYSVKTNSTTITDLVTDRTYYWRVKAFNRNSFCASYSNFGTFKTATTTAANDLDTKSVFEVFPNPLPEDQTLTIQVTTPDKTKLSVRLLDMSGKLIQTANYEILAGDNTLKFTPNKIAKGIYLLNFTSDKGNAVKRIIIQ
ncbi:MAG: T9SS type A sorting domain-containing protein [Saprospiraceae bacterium]|nr:T9SS type A sorting domain-containing protein [Saprospiraceae bacterium]